MMTKTSLTTFLLPCLVLTSAHGRIILGQLDAQEGTKVQHTSAGSRVARHALSPPRGSDFCTWAPDYTCYENGWAACCFMLDDDDSSTPPCPLDPPECDFFTFPGGNNDLPPPSQKNDDYFPPSSQEDDDYIPLPRQENDDYNQQQHQPDYCSWSPDFQCYSYGWPSCCFNNDETDELCPYKIPDCEFDSLSNDICEWAPDYDCFKTGWPACCSSDNDGDDDDATTRQSKCPENELFACDIFDQIMLDNDDSLLPIYGGNYCTWGPDYECYAGGWPSCCFDDNDEACPIAPPACDLLPKEDEEEEWEEVEGDDDDAANALNDDYALDGSDYCTWAPDFDCYPIYGWAACCFDENAPCPEAIPECENTSSSSSFETDPENNEEDHNEDGDEDAGPRPGDSPSLAPSEATPSDAPSISPSDAASSDAPSYTPLGEH